MHLARRSFFLRYQGITCVLVSCTSVSTLVMVFFRKVVPLNIEAIPLSCFQLCFRGTGLVAALFGGLPFLSYRDW
jgi:hypothetical protein